MNLSKSSVLFQIMRIYQCRQLQIICNAYYSWIPFINHTTKCNKKSYAHYFSHIVSQLHDYENWGLSYWLRKMWEKLEIHI